MEKRDKRGLTEAEYLAQYKPGRYPQPSLTVDIILLTHAEGALRVLLVRRGGHPYLGCWALPGGFAEPQETTAQAAARELAEETHAQGLALTPIGLFSTPGRDPRGWAISHAFAALADAASLDIRADDDAADARWFDIHTEEREGLVDLTLTGGGEILHAAVRAERRDTPFGEDIVCTPLRQDGLAFDHSAILCTALLRLR